MPDTAADAPRILAIPGIQNLRDAGGLRTAEGMSLRRGRLFRSAHPGGLDEAGCAALAALGIATVIDLRGRAEAARTPLRGAAGLERIAFPIEARDTAPLAELAATGRATPAAMRDWMIAGYRRYVAQESGAFAEACAAVAERAERGVLIHCTAGKDRTGFVVASLQLSLGVAMEAVVADYVLTDQAWSPPEPKPGMSAEAHRALMAADPRFLAAAFAEAEARHGSLAAFLAQALRLDGACHARLAAALLEPTAAPADRKQ